MILIPPMKIIIFNNYRTLLMQTLERFKTNNGNNNQISYTNKPKRFYNKTNNNYKSKQYI